MMVLFSTVNCNQILTYANEKCKYIARYTYNIIRLVMFVIALFVTSSGSVVGSDLL